MKSEPEEATDYEPEFPATCKEQLSSLALKKRIAECFGIENPKFSQFNAKHSKVCPGASKPVRYADNFGPVF